MGTDSTLVEKRNEVGNIPLLVRYGLEHYNNINTNSSNRTFSLRCKQDRAEMAMHGTVRTVSGLHGTARVASGL